MKKARFLALMAVAALLLVFPAVVLGQPVPPHLSKLVVSIDGSPAADGTEITVWMEGAEVGSATTSGGIAIIRINGEAVFTGKEISFKINGVDAGEKDIWEQGGHIDKSFAISPGGAMEPTAAPPVMVATAAPVAGEKGDKGDKGNTGSAGAAGPAGSAGSDGAKGDAGNAGNAGADGSAGPAGPTGPAGSAGSAGEGGGGGGGAIGVIALILAIVAIAAAGGAFVMGRRGG